MPLSLGFITRCTSWVLGRQAGEHLECYAFRLHRALLESVWEKQGSMKGQYLIYQIQILLPHWSKNHHDFGPNATNPTIMFPVYPTWILNRTGVKGMNGPKCSPNALSFGVPLLKSWALSLNWFYTCSTSSARMPFWAGTYSTFSLATW